MKIVDDKGRLFGSINIIDCIVCMVIVLFALGIWKYESIDAFFSGYTLEEREMINITYSVNGVRDVSIEGVQVGDVFFDKGSRQILGTVVKKEISNVEKSLLSNSGIFIKSVIPDRYNLNLTIECEGFFKDGEYIINDEIFYIGERQEIMSRKCDFYVVVYNIESKNK